MFTGKNKEQFEKWYIEYREVNAIPSPKGVDFFNKYFPFSMQQGVYLEYLDSLKYIITIEAYSDGGFIWDMIHPKDYIPYQFENTYDTRQEALTEAFKKADELINR